MQKSLIILLNSAEPLCWTDKFRRINNNPFLYITKTSPYGCVKCGALDRQHEDLSVLLVDKASCSWSRKPHRTWHKQRPSVVLKDKRETHSSLIEWKRQSHNSVPLLLYFVVVFVIFSCCWRNTSRTTARPDATSLMTTSQLPKQLHTPGS